MLAWINTRSSIIHMLVAKAIFLVITTHANPTETPYRACESKPDEPITVGTRVDTNNDGLVSAWCLGCDELRNCTTVFGSVHLKGISFIKRNEHLRKELRFPHLREITGHLIVTFLKDATSLSDILPNLAVIHGRAESLFQGYALVVYQNEGLQNLGLNSLTVIKQGGIKIEFNPKLCYLDRVRWESVMYYKEAKKLAMNSRNSEDCFAKCSKSCNTPSGHGSSGHKYCWGGERENCQKLCDSKCEQRGCEDGSQEKCCDKECLGGCTRANSPHHCHACQHFRIGNGSCVATCPPGLKEVKNIMCKKECPDDVNFEVNGKCYKKCPVGYKENGKKCDKCDNCPRVCIAPTAGLFEPPIQNIKTLSDSAKLKGCEILNGSLQIEMRNVPGGTNIAKVLTEHLGSLRTINGYLVVRQSTPLISLNFFKNLTSIVTGGDGFSSKDYALAIFDNPNLESLWDFHPNFKIIGGGRSPEKDGVFVQLNPRLCLYNINPLIEDVLKLNLSDPAVDISKTTNGNARLCDVHLVNITIIPWTCKPSLCVRVSWPNKKVSNDYRDVLLYSVWYRETTSMDLNEYDDIDACNSDHVWNRVDAKDSRRPLIVKRIGGLKAYTLYAFRVEAIVIAGTGVKSSITYYKTKQTKPSVPRSLEVSFLSSSSLQVKWKTPFFPNGEITHYVVRYWESESSYLWNIKVNWCENTDSSFTFIEKRDEESEATSRNNSCLVNRTCDCEKENNKEITPDLQEALFARDFQDTILTAVFRKKDDNDNDRVGTTRRPTTTSILPECDNNNKNSSCSTVSPNTKIIPTSNPTTVMSTSPPPTEAPVFTINTTSQTVILRRLKYFTDYTVEVCACNVGAGCGENELFRKQCSVAIGRTEKSDTADNVGDTLKFKAENSTKEFTLDWEGPSRPNGAVLRYDIWIQYPNINENETETATRCASSSKTTYTDFGRFFGSYVAKVRAITPVGNGSWSNEVTFTFTELLEPTGIKSVGEDVNLVTVIAVSITAVLVAVVIFAILMYSFIQRLKKKGNVTGVLFSSTNPEYWNCSEVYVPDEWEVPRHNVTLIRELGNGSFGMVWEGEAVGILPGVDCCKVAVKTVSANSSIRDKVEFLKEASIMKAFNCNHVLRLLGVVSAGDPVLVIMELMENGDLKSFLRKRRPDAEEESSLPPPTDIELYQMAAEIADGMAYLADRKFVHRDLAARNCMVSGNHTCKIGDFGMARDVYETDYYRKGGKGFLPVRWMAPESLKDGIFCSASDVWSFGVVLWEMATLAEQPYQGKSNEEVMKYVLDGNIMDIPESCPRKLVEIMLLCWQYKPRLRQTFLSIVETLEGYLSIEFAERSFYHNDRPRNETDTSSLVSLTTENDNLPELPAIQTIPTEKNARESFV